MIHLCYFCQSPLTVSKCPRCAAYTFYKWSGDAPKASLDNSLISEGDLAYQADFTVIGENQYNIRLDFEHNLTKIIYVKLSKEYKVVTERNIVMQLEGFPLTPFNALQKLPIYLTFL